MLPDGTLFGEGVKTRIKEQLLDECNLHTIVRLPNGVFAPYTGIKTNLLFFTKGEPTKDVWYYEHPYPAGRQVLQQDQADPHRGVRRGEEVVGKPDKRATTANARKTSTPGKCRSTQIKAGSYNLDIKNPHDADDAPATWTTCCPNTKSSSPRSLRRGPS